MKIVTSEQGWGEGTRVAAGKHGFPLEVTKCSRVKLQRWLFNSETTAHGFTCEVGSISTVAIFLRDAMKKKERKREKAEVVIISNKLAFRPKI